MSQCLETSPFSVAESTQWRVVACECEVRATDPIDSSTCQTPPACLKESDLSWCQRGELSGPYGMTWTYYEKFQCSLYSGCAVEYKCLGGACAPAGRYLTLSGSAGGSGSYAEPSKILGNWIDTPSYDPNIRCCGHIDGGGASASAPDVVWNVPKNTWALFGLTWSIFSIFIVGVVYQYYNGARVRVARMRRTHSQRVFVPAQGRPSPMVQPNVVVVPNP